MYVFLVIFWCMTNAIDIYTKFGMIPPEWYIIWSSIFMVNYLSIGFDSAIWIIRIINGLLPSINKIMSNTPTTIGGTIIKSKDLSLDRNLNPNLNPNSAAAVMLGSNPGIGQGIGMGTGINQGLGSSINALVFVGNDIEMVWYHYVLILVFFAMGFIIPSMIRFYIHRVGMKLPNYIMYFKHVSKQLLDDKLHDRTCIFFHRWYNAPMLSISLIIHYILIQLIQFILPESLNFLVKILWCGIWCDHYIYINMIFMAITSDIRTVGKRYNVFKDRIVAHFWSIYLELINLEYYSFGSIYWTFYNTRHINAKLNGYYNNKKNNSKGDNYSDPTLDNNNMMSSSFSLNNYLPILFFPWINYLFTTFTPSLMDVQTKFTTIMKVGGINSGSGSGSSSNNISKHLNIHTLSSSNIS